MLFRSEPKTSGRPDIAGGPELLERLEKALRQDELLVKLGSRIRELAKEALVLVQPKAQPAAGKPFAPASGTEARTVEAQARGATEARAALAQLVRDAEAALAEAGDDLELSGSVRLTWRKKP